MQYASKFWDRIADRHARKPITDKARCKIKIGMAQRRLTPSMKALEFGCGTGSIATRLAPYAGKYEAIDVSKNMIAIANKNLIETPIPNLTFRQAALEEYPYAESSADIIICDRLLHLLKNPKSAIEKIYHMLEPGGFFLSNTPCLKDRPSFSRFINPVAKRLGLAPGINIFSRIELESWFQSTGFFFEKNLINKNTDSPFFYILKKPVFITDKNFDLF